MEKSGRGRRRTFSDEYKVEAVRLVSESGKSVGAIARELGIGETALRRWVVPTDNLNSDVVMMESPEYG
jgi:transposase